MAAGAGGGEGERGGEGRQQAERAYKVFASEDTRRRHKCAIIFTII